MNKKPQKKFKRFKMSNEQKTEIASDQLKTANAQLTVDNRHLNKQIAEVTEEIKVLREQLGQANAIIENDLKADIILKIQAASEYGEAELMSMTPAQLLTIEETLSKGKNFETQTTTFKSIRAGSASQTDSRLTVGNLYGKSLEEIKKMGGDF